MAAIPHHPWNVSKTRLVTLLLQLNGTFLLYADAAKISLFQFDQVSLNMEAVQ
jgi:hypothetical protein